MAVPSATEWKEAVLASMIYIERVVNGRSWAQIKALYPDEHISSIHYAIKFKALDKAQQALAAQVVRSLDPD